MSFFVNNFFFYRRKSLVDNSFTTYSNCQFVIVIDQEEQAAEKRSDLASPSDVTKVVFIDASCMFVVGFIVSMIQ